MTTISANQRTINIINKALALGFEFDQNEMLEQIQCEAEDFLIQNASALEQECEVKSHGNGQYVNWADGKGYEFNCTGEILDYTELWRPADTRLYHETVVDSEGNVIKLYELLGPNEYNAPAGYYYDKHEKQHMPLTYDVHFSDDETDNNKGFSESLEYCRTYIDANNGTNNSYFADYKGGTVSIVCNQTGETVYETEVK